MTHGNFFNFIIRLTETGCYIYIYVWTAFTYLSKNKIAGRLVNIAYGKVLLIPSDIFHAGGISVDGTHQSVALNVTRNTGHVLSMCNSTQTNVFIKNVQYDFSPLYFVKDVTDNGKVFVDDHVEDEDVSLILNI